MSAMSISTLEILEEAQMPPGHARAIARAIESDFTWRLDNLVTKTDLAKLEADLRVDMRDVKSDVVRWVFLAVMGQTALFSGIMYFLLKATISG